MKHIAAYLLCVLGGNASPSADDVTAVITAAGGEADEAQLSLFFSEIEGKNVDELLAEGRTALASCAGAAGAAGECISKCSFTELNHSKLSKILF